MKKIMNFKKGIIGLLVLVMMFSIVACGNKGEEGPSEGETEKIVEEDKSETLSAKDDFGRMIALDKHPERIVSLSPSNTEILFALGLDDEVVGVTEYCDYPEEATKKETVGSFEKSDAEKIISLKPDLVIASGEPNEKIDNILREADIPVLSYEPTTLAEVMSQIRRIGDITGRVDEANKIIKNMEDKKDEIVAKVKDEEPVKVFYEIWHAPLRAAGRGSFMDELIGLAGGDNIAKDSEVAYPEFDIELLIDRNPDVYLTTVDESGKTVESIKERPGYNTIKAIKNDRIYFLDANITSRPGPRLVEALEIIAESLHPGLLDLED